MRPSFNRFQRPGVTRPSAELPVGTNDIKNAIMRGDAAMVWKMLNKASLSYQACRDLLAYAFEQGGAALKVTYGFERGSVSTIKTYLLQHPARHSRFALELAQFALELAIRHKDISTARKALQRSANPENITVCPDAEDMRALLVLARRRNLLYPSPASHAHETELDKALRDVLEPRKREEADKLLNQAIQGKNLQEAWRDAVKDNRLDIQRAILLLRADRDRYFRLLQEDPITDPEMIKVMKEIPYFSPKRGLPKDFNCKAMFPDKNEEIACIHLVEHRQTLQEQSGQLKFDYAQYASEEAIAAHVSYDTEAKHYHLLAHATETHLFHNSDFGKTLVQQLEVMTLKKETTRLLLLGSTNHAMSVGLKIKEKDGKPRYVAELFDPNRTTSHVRVASDSLHAFEMLTLKNFIASENLYKDHYPNPDGLSMMLVRPSPQEEQPMANPAPGAVENRMLTSCIEDKKIDATAIWCMLENGFSGNLRHLKNEIASRSAKERIQLLFAQKETNGIPGILFALYNGRTDAIKAFGELLKLLPPQDRIKLLKAIRSESVQVINTARKDGHDDAIKAFHELFS